MTLKTLKKPGKVPQNILATLYLLTTTHLVYFIRLLELEFSLLDADPPKSNILLCNRQNIAQIIAFTKITCYDQSRFPQKVLLQHRNYSWDTSSDPQDIPRLAFRLPPCTSRTSFHPIPERFARSCNIS